MCVGMFHVCLGIPFPNTPTCWHAQGDTEDEGSFLRVGGGMPMNMPRPMSPSLGASKWGGMGSLPSASADGGLAGTAALSPRIGGGRMHMANSPAVGGSGRHYSGAVASSPAAGGSGRHYSGAL